MRMMKNMTLPFPMITRKYSKLNGTRKRKPKLRGKYLKNIKNNSRRIRPKWQQRLQMTKWLLRVSSLRSILTWVLKMYSKCELLEVKHQLRLKVTRWKKWWQTWAGKRVKDLVDKSRACWIHWSKRKIWVAQRLVWLLRARLQMCNSLAKRKMKKWSKSEPIIS